MYICEIHGKLEHEYCSICDVVVKCDHSDQTSSRLKDMYYESKTSDHYVTMRIYHCDTCGEIKDVEWD